PEGLWFEAKNINVRWEPILAWSGIYVINSAQIDGGHFLREPNLPGKRTPRTPATRHFPLGQIPKLNLASFRIEEAAFDQALPFDRKGDVTIDRGGTVESHIDAQVSSAELVSGTLAKIVGKTIHLTTQINGDVGTNYKFTNTHLASADEAVKVA